MADSSLAFGPPAASAESVEDDCAEMWISAPFSPSNALHKGLKEMEESLRCAICQELMNIPSSLPCHHTFCNRCIQDYAKNSVRSMKRKVNCPTCRIEVSGNDITKSLTPNSSLEQLIHSYKGIRSHLKQALIFTQTKAESTDPETDENNLSISSHVNSRRRKRSRKNYCEDDHDEDNTEEMDSENSEEAKRIHNQAAEKPQKLPKMSYHGKKKKQLKEMCQSEGLSTDGTEEELRARHDAFISLYNAECDSIHPRSRSELVRELTMQEKARKNAAKSSRKDDRILEQLKKNREDLPSKESSIAYSGNAAFDSKLRSNFAQMTAELKARHSKRSSSSSAGHESDLSPFTVKGDNMQSTNRSPCGREKESASPPIAAAETSTSPASTRELSNGLHNPYAKRPTSTGSVSSTMSASSTNGKNAAPFSSMSNVETPTASTAPGIFPNEANAPSTITKMDSQSFALSLSPSLGPLGSVVTKVDSPNVGEKLPLQPVANGLSPNSSADTTRSTKNNVCGPANDAAENGPENRSLETGSKADSNPKPNVTKKSQQTKAKPMRTTTSQQTNARQAEGRAPAPARRSARSIVGPWTCNTCTYDNVKRAFLHSTAKCEMCGNQRPRVPAPMAASQEVITL